MRCKVKVVRDVLDILPKYRPRVGQIYEADYSPSRPKKMGGKHYSGKGEFAVIDILDKRIVLRRGEFEIVGG